MAPTNVLNLTEDIGNDILLESLGYWLDKDVTLIKLIRSPHAMGNRIHRLADTDDRKGLAGKGVDFRLKECRSNMLLINPNSRYVKDYIQLMKDKFYIKDLSGSHYMDENGFIQWHTNQHERPGYHYRVYVTYNEKRGSLFKYILPGTNKVISYEEPIGWYAKVFSIEKELLHCVKANGPRYSFGLFF
jgi:hypothetical protein